MNPTCHQCGHELPDWEGNIMVDQGYRQTRRIDWIKVICKACTRQLRDQGGLDKAYHNLLELRWFKNNGELYAFGIESLLDDLTSQSQSRLVWSRVSIGQMLRLIALALNVEVDEDRHVELWGEADD